MYNFYRHINGGQVILNGKMGLCGLCWWWRKHSKTRDMQGWKQKNKKMKERVWVKRLFQLLSHSWESNLLLFWPKSFSIIHRDALNCKLNSNVIKIFSHKVTPVCRSVPALFTRLRPSARLLAEPRGTQTVWCDVPGGRTLLAAPPEGTMAALVAVVGGKETGAHFLWKWGYHFPNYYCNYWRRPAWEPGLWACRWGDMRDKFRNHLWFISPLSLYTEIQYNRITLSDLWCHEFLLSSLV